MAEEVPAGRFIQATVTIDKKLTTKPKALCERFLHRTSHSSTDRLKRVQQLPCFNEVSSISELVSFDSPLGAPSLCVGNPIASLVSCEGYIFLAIGHVNRI